MAVISDAFEQGVATQLEFSEMDDATLARWLTVPEAIDEWLRRRLGNESRYNKYHGKDGKFAGKNGGGAAGTVTVPIRDQNGTVLGSFELDRSKPMQPQVDAALKKLGMGGAKHSVVHESQRTVRDKTRATPARPAGMKRAKTTSTKDGETAVHDGKAEFPKRKSGTQTVKPTEGRRLKPAEYERLAPTKVTPAEKKAMDFYDLPRGGGKGSGANDVNAYMRGWKDRHLDKNTAEYAKNLKSATARHTVPVDTVVTRRVNLGGLGIKDSDEFHLKWGEDKDTARPRIAAAKERAVRNIVGNVFQDEGFMSTTLKEDIPGGAGVFGNYKMNIRVPKGTHGVYLSNPEQELVLAPKTKLAFLSAQKGADGGWEIDAQVVP